MHSPDHPHVDHVARYAADIRERLRARSPRVHCITNAVAQNFTANMLLAAGAMPSMTIAPEEIATFVAGADALLANLGTFDSERRRAADIAIAAAVKGEIPWVLDPVLIDRAPSRAEYARSLLVRGPKTLRLNQAEFTVLAGDETGVPATIADFARDNEVVIALSGEIDIVADATRTAKIGNGHALMARVTAMGCAASALTAACLAVESDPWRASAAALTIFGIAGQIAGESANGPGSFATAIIDALHGLDGETIVQRAKVA